MTTIARIVERFTMTVEDPKVIHDEWFFDWVQRSPKSAGKHLTAGWLALQSVRDFYRPGYVFDIVREMFAGMGAQALMVEELFAPSDHVLYDYSTDAVEHLRRVFRSPVRAYQEDSYAQPAAYADLVMLDFGDLTVWKTREGERHRELLDSVFSQQPKAVVFTDIACRYLHLHRQRYETLLGAGTCASYDTYLLALLRRFEELWGYVLVRGYYDRWSAVMALVPKTAAGSRIGGELLETPSSPVGLELL